MTVIRDTNSAPSSLHSRVEDRERDKMQKCKLDNERIMGNRDLNDEEGATVRKPEEEWSKGGQWQMQKMQV